MKAWLFLFIAAVVGALQHGAAAVGSEVYVIQGQTINALTDTAWVVLEPTSPKERQRDMGLFKLGRPVTLERYRVRPDSSHRSAWPGFLLLQLDAEWWNVTPEDPGGDTIPAREDSLSRSTDPKEGPRNTRPHGQLWNGTTPSDVLVLVFTGPVFLSTTAPVDSPRHQIKTPGYMESRPVIIPHSGSLGSERLSDERATGTILRENHARVFGEHMGGVQFVDSLGGWRMQYDVTPFIFKGPPGSWPTTIQYSVEPFVIRDPLVDSLVRFETEALPRKRPAQK